jgi:hypothetical protein
LAENRKELIVNISEEKTEKYPWLIKYIHSEKLSEVIIENGLDCSTHPKRVNYLNMISGFIWGEEDDYEKILLLDADGEKILRVGEFEHLSNSMLWGWFKPEKHIVFDPSETVVGAIIRAPDEKEVCYALNVHTHTLYLL